MAEGHQGGEIDARFEGARQLWAGRFQAVIATQSAAEPGYPFASVVPYCLDGEGQALLLLSHLAQHTKNLEADPRCSLSVAQACEGDVQQSLRLTCPADAEPLDPSDHEAAARWFRYYPASRPYFEQLNFRLYRLWPRRFHFNGGFATARWLGRERVLSPTPLTEGAELDLLAALDDLPALLARLADDGRGPPRLAGVDPWGLDLAFGPVLRRIALAGPLTLAQSLRLAVLAAADAPSQAWPAPCPGKRP